MTKFVIDAAMDAGLAHVSANVTALHVCNGDPADRTQVLAQSLATVAFGAADVTLSNGATSGRRNTYAAKASITVVTSGQADTVCLIDGTNLLVKNDVTNAPAVTLTATGEVSTPAFDQEILDPA